MSFCHPSPFSTGSLYVRLAPSRLIHDTHNFVPRLPAAFVPGWYFAIKVYNSPPMLPPEPMIPATVPTFLGLR